jgi:hypothetical protein
MVQGPRFATLHGVGALGLDALPVTIGTSHVGQCPSLLLTVMSPGTPRDIHMGRLFSR